MTRALLIIDVQNDFCEGGSLAVEGGAAVAASITDLVNDPANADRWSSTIVTRDWHVDPGDHWAPEGVAPNFVDTWPVHCKADTPGAEFHDNLQVAADEVFSKGRNAACYSGFEGAADTDQTSLAAWLKDRNVTAVDVVGLATDHCVRATALDARREGLAVKVLLAHCAGVDAATTASALTELADAGVELVD
jgi:nicotinamidase/pyrazinamidase